MTAIYHPGVVTIIPKYDIGQPNNAANVTQWQTAAVGLTVAQLTAVQTAFDTAWVASWKPFAGAGNRYMGCWVIDSASATGNQVTNVAYVPQFGTGSAGSCGDAVAALISLRTPTRYRGGHGRLYIPGAAAGSIANDGHTLQASAITNLTAMWNNTVAALLGVAGSAGGPYNPIVWHKKWTAAPNTVELLSGFTVQPILATQRRRQRKVTRHRRD